jgi:hypothetical protein
MRRRRPAQPSGGSSYVLVVLVGAAAGLLLIRAVKQSRSRQRQLASICLGDGIGLVAISARKLDTDVFFAIAWLTFALGAAQNVQASHLNERIGQLEQAIWGARATGTE